RRTRFARDWSSDVCSSDLEHRIRVTRELPRKLRNLRIQPHAHQRVRVTPSRAQRLHEVHRDLQLYSCHRLHRLKKDLFPAILKSSEERRVGRESDPTRLAD